MQNRLVGLDAHLGRALGRGSAAPRPSPERSNETTGTHVCTDDDADAISNNAAHGDAIGQHVPQCDRVFRASCVVYDDGLRFGILDSGAGIAESWASRMK